MVTLRISKDVEENRRLWERGFPGDKWVGDHHTFWIARDETGTVLGFCSAVYLTGENNVFLSSAAVFPCARGGGLQRRMIRHRVRWAKAQGARYAITYAIKSNYPSLTNLIRAGFRFYVPATSWAGDVHYFERKLN